MTTCEHPRIVRIEPEFDNEPRYRCYCGATGSSDQFTEGRTDGPGYLEYIDRLVNEVSGAIDAACDVSAWGTQIEDPIHRNSLIRASQRTLASLRMINVLVYDARLVGDSRLIVGD